MSSYDNGATTPAYLVTSSCDGTTAPAFPPFNNEGSPATSVCDDTCTCPALQQRFVTRVSNVIVDRQVCDADCPKCQDQFCPTNCLCLRRQGSAEDKLGRRLEVTTREVCDSDCPACQDDEGDESGDEGDDEVCDDTCTCPADGEDTRRSLARRVFLEPVTCSPTCAKCNDPAPVCSNCVCPGTPDAVLGFALVCDATCSQCTNTGGNESDDEDGEGEGSNEETCTNGERYIPTNTPTPRAFNIMCDTALVGTASGTTTAPDLHSCINACELTQGCTAVAFLKLQNVPDNCAFYGDGSQYVPTAVVDIAFADGHQPPRYTGPA